MKRRRKAAGNWKIYCLNDNKTRLPAAADAVQIRRKNMPSPELARIALEMKRSVDKIGSALIVNDRVDAALASGADGVHLGEGDLPVKSARRLAGKRLIVGKTVHSLREARAAAREKIDYVGAGPVFRTPAKKRLKGRGPDFIRKVALIVKRPVLAIGGINRNNAGSVLASGAKCLCLGRAAKDAAMIKALIR